MSELKKGLIFRQMCLSLAAHAMNHHSKSAPPYHLRNGFISLPEEVTEKIVVELARDQLQLGRGVAAFAQTCKQHRAMIYQPVDHSLWRRIYLTKYDDLRQISNRHRLYQATNFDWGLAFRERIRAYNYLRAVPMIEDTESEDAPRADSGYETNDDEQNLRSINALLSLIDTVLPVSVCMADFSPGGKTYREYWHSVSFETAHLRAVKPPASFDWEDAPSLNTVEYHESIAHGLPASLLSRLNSNTLDPEWDSTPLATALYKLIAQHALLSATRRSGWEPFALTSNMPSLIMHKRAYDLTRLKRGHLYGPFLSLTPDPEEDVDPADPFQFTPDWSHLVVIALIMRRILDSYDSWMEGYTLGADALRPGAWLRSELEDEGSKRDWAGVEGMWRRLETWLAMPVFASLNGDTWESLAVDLALPAYRARHLVPCRLRVVSYSREPGCLPDFPTIHFEGETGMEIWHEYGDESDDDDANICFVDGQTSMLVEGSVRWSFHMYHGSGKQWSFEGVQIGGIGSIVGIIGVWRGADTMGFWWQWKVA